MNYPDRFLPSSVSGDRTGFDLVNEDDDTPINSISRLSPAPLSLLQNLRQHQQQQERSPATASTTTFTTRNSSLNVSPSLRPTMVLGEGYSNTNQHPDYQRNLRNACLMSAGDGNVLNYHSNNNNNNNNNIHRNSPSGIIVNSNNSISSSTSSNNNNFFTSVPTGGTRPSLANSTTASPSKQQQSQTQLVALVAQEHQLRMSRASASGAFVLPHSNNTCTTGTNSPLLCRSSFASTTNNSPNRNFEDATANINSSNSHFPSKPPSLPKLVENGDHQLVQQQQQQRHQSEGSYSFHTHRSLTPRTPTSTGDPFPSKKPFALIPSTTSPSTTPFSLPSLLHPPPPPPSVTNGIIPHFQNNNVNNNNSYLIKQQQHQQQHQQQYQPQQQQYHQRTRSSGGFLPLGRTHSSSSLSSLSATQGFGAAAIPTFSTSSSSNIPNQHQHVTSARSPPPPSTPTNQELSNLPSQLDSGASRTCEQQQHHHLHLQHHQYQHQQHLSTPPINYIGIVGRNHQRGNSANARTSPVGQKTNPPTQLCFASPLFPPEDTSSALASSSSASVLQNNNFVSGVNGNNCRRLSSNQYPQQQHQQRGPHSISPSGHLGSAGGSDPNVLQSTRTATATALFGDDDDESQQFLLLHHNHSQLRQQQNRPSIHDTPGRMIRGIINFNEDDDDEVEYSNHQQIQQHRQDEVVSFSSTPSNNTKGRLMMMTMNRECIDRNNNNSNMFVQVDATSQSTFNPALALDDQESGPQRIPGFSVSEATAEHRQNDVDDDADAAAAAASNDALPNDPSAVLSFSPSTSPSTRQRSAAFASSYKGGHALVSDSRPSRILDAPNLPVEVDAVPIAIGPTTHSGESSLIISLTKQVYMWTPIPSSAVEQQVLEEEQKERRSRSNKNNNNTRNKRKRRNDTNQTGTTSLEKKIDVSPFPGRRYFSDSDPHRHVREAREVSSSDDEEHQEENSDDDDDDFDEDNNKNNEQADDEQVTNRAWQQQPSNNNNNNNNNNSSNNNHTENQNRQRLKQPAIIEPLYEGRYSDQVCAVAAATEIYGSADELGDADESGVEAIYATDDPRHSSGAFCATAKGKRKELIVALGKTDGSIIILRLRRRTVDDDEMEKQQQQLQLQHSYSNFAGSTYQYNCPSSAARYRSQPQPQPQQNQQQRSEPVTSTNAATTSDSNNINNDSNNNNNHNHNNTRHHYDPMAGSISLVNTQNSIDFASGYETDGVAVSSCCTNNNHIDNDHDDDNNSNNCSNNNNRDNNNHDGTISSAPGSMLLQNFPSLTFNNDDGTMPQIASHDQTEQRIGSSIISSSLIGPHIHQRDPGRRRRIPSNSSNNTRNGMIEPREEANDGLVRKGSNSSTATKNTMNQSSHLPDDFERDDTDHNDNDDDDGGDEDEEETSSNAKGIGREETNVFDRIDTKSRSDNNNNNDNNYSNYNNHSNYKDDDDDEAEHDEDEGEDYNYQTSRNLFDNLLLHDGDDAEAEDYDGDLLFTTTTADDDTVSRAQREEREQNEQRDQEQQHVTGEIQTNPFEGEDFLVPHHLGRSSSNGGDHQGRPQEFLARATSPRRTGSSSSSMALLVTSTPPSTIRQPNLPLVQRQDRLDDDSDDGDGDHHHDHHHHHQQQDQHGEQNQNQNREEQAPENKTRSNSSASNLLPSRLWKEISRKAITNLHHHSTRIVSLQIIDNLLFSASDDGFVACTTLERVVTENLQPSFPHSVSSSPQYRATNIKIQRTHSAGSFSSGFTSAARIQSPPHPQLQPQQQQTTTATVIATTSTTYSAPSSSVPTSPLEIPPAAVSLPASPFFHHHHHQHQQQQQHHNLMSNPKNVSCGLHQSNHHHHQQQQFQIQTRATTKFSFDTGARIVQMTVSPDASHIALGLSASGIIVVPVSNISKRIHIERDMTNFPAVAMSWIASPPVLAHASGGGSGGGIGVAAGVSSSLHNGSPRSGNNHNNNNTNNSSNNNINNHISGSSSYKHNNNDLEALISFGTSIIMGSMKNMNHTASSLEKEQHKRQKHQQQMINNDINQLGTIPTALSFFASSATSTSPSSLLLAHSGGRNGDDLVITSFGSHVGSEVFRAPLTHPLLRIHYLPGVSGHSLVLIPEQNSVREISNSQDQEVQHQQQQLVEGGAHVAESESYDDDDHDNGEAQIERNTTNDDSIQLHHRRSSRNSRISQLDRRDLQRLRPHFISPRQDRFIRRSQARGLFPLEQMCIVEISNNFSVIKKKREMYMDHHRLPPVHAVHNPFNGLFVTASGEDASIRLWQIGSSGVIAAQTMREKVKSTRDALAMFAASVVPSRPVATSSSSSSSSMQAAAAAEATSSVTVYLDQDYLPHPPTSAGVVVAAAAGRRVHHQQHGSFFFDGRDDDLIR